MARDRRDSDEWGVFLFPYLALYPSLITCHVLSLSQLPIFSFFSISYTNSSALDASKVPPSRFQKRKGSIYAVPGSRDGHVDSNYAAKFHEKHAEKGYTDVFKKASYHQTN